MTTNELGKGHEPLPSIDEQIKQIGDFVDGQLAGVLPVQYDHGGAFLSESREAPVNTDAGSRIFCESSVRLTPVDSQPVSPDERTIALSRLEGQGQISLGIFSNDTFRYASVAEGNVLFYKEGVALKEALADSGFAGLVKEIYDQVVAGEIPKPDTPSLVGLLPTKSLLHIGREADKDGGLTYEIGYADKPLRGQDAALIDEVNGVYGVFDGLGGEGASDIAARLAAGAIQEQIAATVNDTNIEEVLNGLIAAIEHADQSILDWNSQLGDAGATTAIVGRIVHLDGADYLVWVSVGDSRLYVKTSEGSLVQHSQDEVIDKEGKRNIVTNSLGKTGHFRGVSQQGTVELDKGSKIVLVSDGITGDKQSDLLTDDAILGVLETSSTPQSAADGLVGISRKNDDKTALVIHLH